jgi:hypothetical protein
MPETSIGDIERAKSALLPVILEAREALRRELGENRASQHLRTPAARASVSGNQFPRRLEASVYGERPRTFLIADNIRLTALPPRSSVPTVIG